MSEWRPIETAPKEGRILAAKPGWNKRLVVETAYYDSDRAAKRPRPFWRFERWQISDSRASQPTFWMPLPEPPKEA